jgi:hypothetical protein
MLKKIKLKKVLILLLIVFVVMQFFRIDKGNMKVYNVLDFVEITKASPEIRSILKTSCYDCHSNEVVYPWYTNIAPLSWWIKQHINEGSRHLNFSIWGMYKSRRMDKKLKECVEMIEEGEMPMTSYTLIHSTAKLSDQQKAILIAWFNSLRTGESDKPRNK